MEISSTMLAQSTLISDLARINYLLKSCSQTAAEIQQPESSVVATPESDCGEDEAILYPDSPNGLSRATVLPQPSLANETQPCSPKGILKRPSTENLQAPAAESVYSGTSPASVRKFAQGLLPRRAVAVGAEVSCSSSYRKLGAKKRVTFSLDRDGDRAHLVDHGYREGDGAVAKTENEEIVTTMEELGDQWNGEGGTVYENKEKERESNENNSDGNVCDMNKNQTNGCIQRVTVNYNNLENSNEQIDNFDEVFESGKNLDRRHELDDNDQINSMMNYPSLVSCEPSDNNHSVNQYSADNDSTPVLETPIHFASIVEIIHADVVREKSRPDTKAEISDDDGGGYLHKESSTGQQMDNFSDDGHSLGKESCSSSVFDDVENEWENGEEEESVFNGQNDDDVSDDNEDDVVSDEDDTMVVHEVEEDNIRVCPNSFGHFMSHMFEGIGEQQQADNTKAVIAKEDSSDDRSASQTIVEVTNLKENRSSSSDDIINNETVEIETVKPKENKANALQTFDREQMSANRGTYSRMYLRQFKSNIYKGRKWPSKSPEVDRQVSLDTEGSDSPAPLPTPPTTPITKTSPEQNKLLQKLDHISEMLEQINTGSSLNSPSRPVDSTLHQKGGQSAAIFQYNDVCTRRSSSVKSKRMQGALKQIFFFTMAVLLYLLSVLALLAITFPRLEVSMQRTGLSPV